MKAKSLIVSLILIICFAGIGIGLYCAWPAITGTITDSKYYTSEDLQDAYDKGFDDAFKNKDELTQQVDYYKELTDTYYISILDYQAQIKDYETLTENNKNTISNLEQNKTELQTQVNNLTTIKNSNEETISDLQDEVRSLENQVKVLTSSDSGKAEEIAELNKQITSLNNLISQLQNTNTLNVNTIASLNSQIESLNSQISNMTLQNQTASSQITALNNKISELQESINYYEQYIASLENGEQVVATFEFDGSVYNIQIVNKNSIVTVTTPTSTDYVIFNYWTVNGEQVDLSTYQITANTKFVANVTHKYDVVFKVDNEEYNKQIVVKNNFAVEPTAPTKENSTFKGWSVNGKNVINVSSYEITGNTTFVALFELNTCDVSFMVEEEAYRTESVTYGSYANIPTPPTKENYVFKGWSVNGTDIVDVASYKIVKDTTFIAVFEIKTYTVSFMANDTECDNQVIAYGNFATEPEAPTKENYIFKGWSINGIDVIDVTSYEITGNTTFVALFEKVYKLTFMSNGVQHATLDYSEMNKNINVSDPTLKYYNFIGWSINGTDIIDVASYKIVEDTTFVAVFDTEYTDEEICNFVLNEMVDGMLDLSNTLIHTIPESMFYKNNSITNIKLPNTLIEIGDMAFAECSNLIEVIIPDSVITIGGAFTGCTNLQKVVLSKNIKQLCYPTFFGCTSLKSIYIPISVTIINGWEEFFSMPPFGYCSEDLKIFCEASEKPSGWADNFNNVYDDIYCEVFYGYSYEQYLEAIKVL